MPDSGMDITGKVAVAFLSLLLAGCGSPGQLELGPNHPATPQAAASPIAPLETGLLSSSNQLRTPSTASPEAVGHNHDHQEGHSNPSPEENK